MIAVGTDILEVARMEAVLARQGERFVRRILTPEEFRDYQGSGQPARLLARRFAAKEAVAKALGTGIGRGVSWQDIQIAHDAAGAPRVELAGGAREVMLARAGSAVLISISDERHYTVAFAALV